MGKIIIGLGEIAVLIGSYLIAALYIPGQKNTYKQFIVRWAEIKTNLSPINCFHIHTILFMLLFSSLYFIILLYFVFLKRSMMPGREFGTSSLIPASTLNKKLADLNNGINDPQNKVVYEKNYNAFEKLIQRIKHRKDD